MLGLVDLKPHCWLEIVCILKVLRPVNYFKVFLGPKTNAELVPKFHAAALPMETLKISPYTNVTLTFDFDFGLDDPVHGVYGWRHPT
jgi:hypothetical protein